MSLVLDDLNARARGLAGHLLGRAGLEALAGLADPPGLAQELERAGYGPSLPAGPITPAVLEAGVRRVAAARLRLLARWAGRRARHLAVLFEDEDRRSLRALLRGAAAGAAPEARLAGLLPTPGLPGPALLELARQPAPAGVASLLAAWGHPYGPALLPETRGTEPSLVRLELAINRRFAERALGAARGRGRALEAYVRRVIDLENTRAALLLAGGAGDLAAAECFLPGGRRLSRAAFLAAAASEGPGRAAALLAAAFDRTRFAPILGRHGADPAALERALLAAAIREQTEAARSFPIGPAPLLGYLLRLRAEVIDLRRIVWGRALGAPPGALIASLVSAS